MKSPNFGVISKINYIKDFKSIIKFYMKCFYFNIFI